MSIFATDTPMHPKDREAWWVSMKKAYLNNARAVNHFSVRPIYRINLLRHRNEQQPSGLRFALVCALNAVGLVAGLALAFGLLVVLGAVMGAI